MIRAIALLVAAVLASGVTVATPGALSAQQGGFATVITVNGHPISAYEIAQRKLFLQLLRTPGDIDKQARDGLIEDRLRVDAATRAGIKLSEDDVKAGMDEFAGRANLTADQFIAAIGQGGVSPATYRDFVTAGVIWRAVIRAKYADRVTISEAEIDRALSLTSHRGAGARVLLAEIVIPAPAGNVQGAAVKATKLAATLKSEGDFARAARENSAAPSRNAGGKLGWIPLSNLPPAVQPVIAGLQPGQISEPVPVPGGVALFQLRAIDKGGDVSDRNVTVDYAQYTLSGAGEAASVRNAARTCDDLYPIARKAGRERLVRVTQPLGSVPADIAGELASLDENEAATVVRGGSAVLVMLCNRTATGAAGGAAATADTAAPPPSADQPAVRDTLGFGAGPSREGVRQELVNDRLNGLSDVYLAQLKANAIITGP